MKLNEILIIGGMFISVVFVGLFAFYLNAATVYGGTDIDVSEIQSYNQSINEINANAQDVAESVGSLSGSTNTFDIFGSVVTGGFAAIKIAGISFNTIFNVATDGIDTLPIADLKPVLIVFAGGALLIIIIVGIILPYIRPSDRL